MYFLRIHLDCPSSTGGAKGWVITPHPTLFLADNLLGIHLLNPATVIIDLDNKFAIFYECFQFVHPIKVMFFTILHYSTTPILQY